MRLHSCVTSFLKCFYFAAQSFEFLVHATPFIWSLKDSSWGREGCFWDFGSCLIREFPMTKTFKSGQTWGDSRLTLRDKLSLWSRKKDKFRSLSMLICTFWLFKLLVWLKSVAWCSWTILFFSTNWWLFISDETHWAHSDGRGIGWAISLNCGIHFSGAQVSFVLSN